MSGSWKFFSYDPDTDSTVNYQVLDDGRWAFQIVQHVDKIIGANVEAEKASHGRRFGEWNRMASVPVRLVEKSGIDTAISMQDKKFISKWMNDGDHAKFRTSRGKA
jgi:hypothetical protein